MYLLYSLLLTVGFVLLLPRFLWDAVFHGKYAEGFWERAGHIPRFDSEGKPIIWLHCVSVGETQAARPIAHAVLQEFPSHALVVSTTTRTGQRVARQAFDGLAQQIFYFPFDWSWSVRRTLNRIKPALVLVMETELWPRFLRECRKRDVAVVLLNGRISDKSFRRYRRIKFFIRRVVNDLRLAIMQSEADADRIRALELNTQRVKVAGNVKFDSEAEPTNQPLTAELQRRFNFGDARALIVVASTHAPEERIVLEAFKIFDAKAGLPDTRLLIAPRHPERFDEVATLLEKTSFSWARRTNNPHADDVKCRIVLLDTVGELRAVYPLADLVFVGGSIAPVGGHNVIEPALFAKCILTGAHTSNFRSIVESFRERDALVQLSDLPNEQALVALAEAFDDLLKNESRRRSIGEAARAVLDENRGATARIVTMLKPFLENQQSKRRDVAPN